MPSGRRAPARREEQTQLPRPLPEKKFGPYGSGIDVAVWLNTVDTDEGSRQFRSITISPRRYRDKQTGEWRDASSYRPSDIAALVFALGQAQAYVFTTPFPGESADNGR